MTQTTDWTSSRVRETFLSFFERKDHRRVSSSSLVPAEDPTLLFTNAGMNQFKDCFLGREVRAYNRATTSQKCVRAGGKHNDLDNVGYTARHHTFFEMLGNFSFGDYFKLDAIDFAWELITSKEYFGLDPSRLWATVYTTDDEAAELWARYLPKERIARFGEKDNFWSMGDTGPCGPCTEIHYDQGPDVPGDATPNSSGDRVIEIWNLVFMQFDRDAQGNLTPLPKPSVDTGAGLERITALLEGKNNNYDTDLFRPLLDVLETISGRTYVGGMAVEDAPFRVVVDHARAATLLLADGVLPSNEGRGYVLRRILRRAMRYARRLGITRPFLGELVDPVFSVFQDIHFEGDTAGRRENVKRQLLDEEERFAKTMSAGADRVGEAVSEARRTGETRLSGATVFRFYDTFGIPLELITELAEDEGVAVEHQGFDVELAAAKERSKGASKFEAEGAAVPEGELDPAWVTEFLGYPEQSFVSLPGATVLGLFRAEEGKAPKRVASLPAGATGFLVSDRTVFYPEGGGQVADSGEVRFAGGRASIGDTRKGPGGRVVLHRVSVDEGTLAEGASVDLHVDEWQRRKTQANHTATHLLHAALRTVLGESVRQMGSLVAPDRLRFDYAVSKAPTAEQLARIDRLVNEEVLRDRAVTKDVVGMDEAKKRGAVMFFGEKYGETVRVVDVPGFSMELCGGCHVNRTGEIGGFKIVSDKALASGVRRLEAVTALNLVERLGRDEDLIAELAEVAQSAPEDLVKKLRDVQHRLKEQEKEIAKLKVQLATGGAAASEADETIDVGGVKVLAKRVPALPANELRNLADTFRGKLKSGVVLLGMEAEGKVTLLAAVTPDTLSRISAHELAQAMAPVVGGKGGGKPDFAQAGGKDGSKIEAAFAAGIAKVREKAALPG